MLPGLKQIISDRNFSSQVKHGGMDVAWNRARVLAGWQLQ